MTHCAKCGAELIGSRKFCAACGTPAGDPRSPAASTGMSPAAAPTSSPGSARQGPVSSGPSIQYAPAPPASQVNPFAQTANPGAVRAADYGPPPSVPLELASTTPGVGDPSKGPQVSPLATSNVASTRPESIDKLIASVRSPSPDSLPSGMKRGGVPGTQLMPSMADPSMANPSAAKPAAGVPAPKAGRTQVLGVFPGVARPVGPGTPQSFAPSGPGASTPGTPGSGTPFLPAPPLAAPPAPKRPSMAPSAGLVAPPGPSPSSPALSPGSAPGPAPGPAPSSPALASGGAPYGAAPHAPPPPQPPPQQPPPPQHQGPGVPLPSSQGWNPAAYAAPPPPMAPPPPPAPPPAFGYAFGYAPGSRVHVTWSNGQRYPGTVTQVTGNQCLIVFPDGQHHWVEMQYVTPA